ncbi:GspH/FimT family pseudopilin [Thiorhodovibrio frisius]|uniref:GspH/FimT family pseudopilin n=1 Tax=Thiorhodovibrio frisius TaxID=631362 RepID=UPI000255F0DF|nr:GspH/FimT family pseudopilin [Thiorhodovibrio frisius]
MVRPTGTNPTVPRRAARGVTLIELMVTLAVAAILMTVAVPSFESVIKRNRAAGVTNQFMQSLRLARSEAVKRGRNVIVCPSKSTSGDSPTCDADAVWTDGWIIYVDENRDNAFNSTDALIRVGQLSSPNVQIIAPSRFENYIGFRPTGMNFGSDDLSKGTIRLCVSDERREITINITGRMTLEKLEKGDCE